MTKIFRKIRQNLLTENKLSKYFLYAVGEIVLVVIGILIALQLNLYRENQKNEKVEIGYLKGILSELDQDIYHLDGLLIKDSLQLNSYTLLLRAFTENGIKTNPSFIKAIGLSNTYHAFDGNNIVFDDMKFSGKINYIKSDLLRFSILKYYRKSEKIVQSQNRSANGQIRELASEAFLTNIDLNSLIERFMFPAHLSAELDELDLSFFDKDIKDMEVKKFANSISTMKAIVQRNSSENKNLLHSSKELKVKIIEYLTSKGIEIRNEVPKEIL